MAIRTIKSGEKANYPFVLEFRNVFGHWCAVSSHLTDQDAQDAGTRYIAAGSNCGRPLRITHYTGGPFTR